jgi:hypothetical protein
LSYLKEVMVKMVDTVKLLITIYDPLELCGVAFDRFALEQLIRGRGGARIYFNPSPKYATALGKYLPSLTLTRRASKVIGVSYQLAVEFSAPKMLFNNNFSEITEADFEQLLTVLQAKLLELTGRTFTRDQLAQSDVGSWHPCKNIIFQDYTSCQTILSTIAKLDVSRTYDLERTSFRDGHVVHIHCNSVDVAFYDKMADLRKAKISEKRAFGNDNAIQLPMLKPLKGAGPIEVLRQEVRLGGRQSLKRAFPGLGVWTFETLFRKHLNQAVLLKHWHKLADSVDMLSLDVNKPSELLQNYLIENPGIKPLDAMAAVTGLLVSGRDGVIGLRNLVEAYNPGAWPRIKKLLHTPQPHRFTHFQHVQETLEQFTPVRMGDYFKNVDNNSK